MKLFFSTYFEALALFLLLTYLADTKITLWPFSISFGRGLLVLGFILIALGTGLVYYQGRWNGLKRGAEIKEEAMKEAVKEYREELKKQGL